MAGLVQLLDTRAGHVVASTAVVFGVQRLVSTFDAPFYKSLHKPRYTPPNYMFPLVWIPLKLMQSVSLALVVESLKERSASELALPLAAFGAQMALGNWWNVVFFGRHKLRQSLWWMGGFWLSLAGTVFTFKQVSPTAANLMVPTLVWVAFAAKLNYDIVKMNP